MGVCALLGPDLKSGRNRGDTLVSNGFLCGMIPMSAAAEPGSAAVVCHIGAGSAAPAIGGVNWRKGKL